MPVQVFRRRVLTLFVVCCRQMEFLPQKFSCLRHVPLYAQGIRERFERCLDLYLCPRAMREKLQVDPDSLLPKLPDPSELRPFPTTSAFQFRGHKSRVRSISVDPSGQWLVSGSDDKTIKLWEISSGRCVRTWELDSVPQNLAWCPNAAVAVVAIAVDNKLVFLYAGTATPVNAESTFDALRGWRAEAAETDAATDKKPRNVVTVDDESKTAAADENESSDDEDDEAPAAGADTTGIPVRTAQWHTDVEHTGNTFPSKHSDLLPRLGATFSTGVKVVVLLSSAVKRVVWHRKGDYIATVCPNAPSGAVMIHQLSKRSSNCPFKKNHGQVQTVAFHPTQPHFLVANQRSVRVYDLVKEALLKKLEPGVKWISTVDMHPSGDHVVVGSYDHRTVWFDTELSDRPYKTLRYHTKAVRRTAFHSLYPLMATASDDGSVHVFHAKVFNDFVQNPVIIPVKILRGHAVTEDGLGVLDCAFHPLHPWLITAGADHNIQLWHNLP
jgi:ribosome biogenesis protein ERB1